MNAAESRIWYAMRVTYRRELAAEAILNAKGIACYIPKKQCPDPKNKGKKIAVPVIHNLIFVHAAPSEMRKLKSDMEIPYLQYMMDARAGKKITVPDRRCGSSLPPQPITTRLSCISSPTSSISPRVQR